jgi:hypothetical protein
MKHINKIILATGISLASLAWSGQERYTVEKAPTQKTERAQSVMGKEQRSQRAQSHYKEQRSQRSQRAQSNSKAQRSQRSQRAQKNY